MPEERKKLTTDHTHETAEFDTSLPPGGTPIDGAGLPGIKVRKNPEKVGRQVEDQPDWDVRGGSFEGPAGGAGGLPEVLEEQVLEERALKQKLKEERREK